MTFLNSRKVDTSWWSAGGPIDVPGDTAVHIVSGGESVGFTAEGGADCEVPSLLVRVFRFDKVKILNL